MKGARIEGLLLRLAIPLPRTNDDHHHVDSPRHHHSPLYKVSKPTAALSLYIVWVTIAAILNYGLWT